MNDNVYFSTFNFDKKAFVVRVIPKRIQRMTFRFDGKEIRVSVPLKTPWSIVESLLPSMIPKLLKKYHPLPEREDAYLWFGTWKMGFPFPQEQEKKRALQTYAKPFIAALANQLNVGEPRLMIRTMNTRWGTYSRRTHRVTLSTKLIHYPPEVIQAVIAHEMAHTVHFDHSPRFYATLYRLFPDYARHHATLKSGIQ